MCPSLCASMYTAPVYKGWPSSSSSVQGVSKFVHMLCTNWTQAWAHVYISKQFPSLGTPTSTAVYTVYTYYFARPALWEFVKTMGAHCRNTKVPGKVQFEFVNSKHAPICNERSCDIVIVLPDCVVVLLDLVVVLPDFVVVLPDFVVESSKIM